MYAFVSKPFLSILILISGLIILKCDLKDPENILGYDRIAAQPIDVAIKQVDFFTLEIRWQVENPEDVASFSIYRAISETESVENEQYHNIDQLLFTDVAYDTLAKRFSYLDTTADYGKWNKYYFVSDFKNLSSLRSELVYHDFRINPPLISLTALDQAHVFQKCSISDPPIDKIDGVEITRQRSGDETVTSIIYSQTGDSVLWTVDSLRFSSSVDSLYLGRQIYIYDDIEPNISYTYQARAFQVKGAETRYSEYSISREISIPRIPLSGLKMRPISENSIRYYFDPVDANYDSVLLFGCDHDTIDKWIYIDSHLIEDIPYYEYLGQYIYDVKFEQQPPLFVKIVLEGKNSHSLFAPDANDIYQKDTLHTEELGILGFTLVEGGVFVAGCLDQDVHCQDNEFPGSGVEHILEVTPFYLSVYEVSEDVYNNPGSWPTQEGQIPIDNVSWNDAINYCKTLGEIYTDFIFSLPDELEWEYAAKWNYLSNNGSIYPWGNEIDIYSANYSNYLGALNGVGAYPNASFQGAFDMAGNVLEWVASCYSDSLLQAPADTTCWRVARGGGYWQGPLDQRTTSRQYYPADLHAAGLGFRVKMVKKPEVNL